MTKRTERNLCYYKTMKFLIVIFLLFLLIPPLKSFAQTMSNSQYIIKMGNLNAAAGKSSNSQYNLNETLGQISPGLYSGTNYTVKAGFAYIKTGQIPFSFSISQNILDFGVITPTNPVTRTTNLTVSAGPSKGFTIIASENLPLTSSVGIIPDTTCDNGDCNSAKAALWTSSLTYGFGYRCDPSSPSSSGQANVCPSDFNNANFYKPFAATPSAMSIMASNVGGVNKQSQITYKVNVSGSQAPGLYTNIVTYIASPGF